MIFFAMERKFQKLIYKSNICLCADSTEKEKDSFSRNWNLEQSKKKLRRKTVERERKAGTACSLRPCGILEE